MGLGEMGGTGRGGGKGGDEDVTDSTFEEMAGS